MGIDLITSGKSIDYVCHSSDYSQTIFEWLKLYRERSGKLCHEEMAEVFGGDFSKDGELGIERRISSRGFPETGLSGVGWRMSTSLGGCMACYICIVGIWESYAVWLENCFWSDRQLTGSSAGF